MGAHAVMRSSKIILVGNGGFAHVAESLFHAATTVSGVDAFMIDIAQAASGSRLVNALAWRLLDHRPPFYGRVANSLIAAVREAGSCTVLTTGLSPVDAATLGKCQSLGARLLHYSTDDPWNANQSARWLLKALPLYDAIFTPRTRNIDDFVRLGCRDVRHLPFGYDERLLTLPGSPGSPPPPDVLYVGGADGDRARFFDAFLKAGGDVALVGGFWDRHGRLGSKWLGHRSPGDVVALTRAAKVNIILVRRANRDGHVMRSLEAGALGGCLLVEDTSEHRALFGDEGETVRYFSDAQEASLRAQHLLQDQHERHRLASAVRRRIRKEGHTYRDRLMQMRVASLVSVEPGTG
jgi:spore maturation protein CgeB